MKVSLVRQLLVMLALSVLVAAPALAEGPAVSAINGKIEALGGNVDGDSAEAVAGSLSLPLNERLGAQFDAAYGEVDDEEIKGAGLHLFIRDPESYLLGVNGVYAELEDIELERYAVEGEYYVGPLSIAALLGRQTGDVDETSFGNLDLRLYPIENLMLEAGGSFADSNEDKLHFGAEFQAIAGLAFFADLALGEDDYEHTLGGVRYYFGEKKSLVKRHREDDPINAVIPAIHTLKAFSLARNHGHSQNVHNEEGCVSNEGVHAICPACGYENIVVLPCGVNSVRARCFACGYEFDTPSI